MSPTPFACIFLIMALTSGCAVAQTGGRFNTMDINDDGYIDAAELRALRLAAFDRADTNGDGMLDREEAVALRDSLPRQPGGAAGAGFDLADHDGDGFIRRSDVEAAPPRLIEAADSNGDGRLSRKELRRYFLQMRKAR